MTYPRTAFYGCLLIAALRGTSGCADGSEGTGGAGATGSGTGSHGASGSGGEGAMGSGGEGGQGGSSGCDPASTPMDSSCVITDSLGVFVRAEGDDMAAGTKQAPVRTLAKAIELAQTSGKRVYACAQTFAEAVIIPAGVELYGGLSCETDWSWVDSKPTEITAAADQVPVVRLVGGTGTTVLSDLRVHAPDASVEGGSSIAMIVDGADATLTRCILAAGEARHGAHGPEHAGTGEPGPNGTPGFNSDCMGLPVGGGAQKQNPACPTSVGGKGGNSASASSIAGTDGADGLPLFAGTGQGGAGENAVDPVVLCTTGGAGADGAIGAVGSAGAGNGTLSSSGYTGIAGGNGQPGTAGQGGGGGGGGRGCLVNGEFKGDDSGGSGGAGGCGGKGAVGGGAGGSSIALVMLNANVTLEECALSAALAGNGGQGGFPQAGGAGGLGGLGAVDTGFDVYSGCKGGAGGVGGIGGLAGGGAGGHSLSYAYVGAPPTKTGGTYKHGAGGSGGLGTGGSIPLVGSNGTGSESLEF